MQILLSFFRRFPILAAAAVLGVVLPGCSLARSGLGAASFAYNCTATLQLADGSRVTVNNYDVLLGGGTAQIFSADDSDGGAAYALDHWKRYLTQRLSAPGPSAEFEARFGSAPWCLVSAEATVTPTSVRGVMPPPSPAPVFAPLPDCTMPTVPEACANPPGVVPITDVTPSPVDFGSVPVGTMSPETVVTISNVGAGRLCLYGPTLNAALSPNRADFLPLDASDCAPRTVTEMGLGLAILDATRPACSVRVHVTPSDPGLRAARLRFNVTDTDPSRAFVDVPLTATGVAGGLTYRTARCFPTTTGCSTVRHGIRNDGPGNVTIRSAALPSAAMTAGWSIAGLSTTGGIPTTLPVTLAPLNLLLIDIQVCGATAADTTLTVTSNSTTPVITTDLQREGGPSGCTPMP